MKDLPVIRHPDLLVGIETSDDAGVYKLSPEVALVQTLDFFTPIVDDPYHFGRISAANALSDVCHGWQTYDRHEYRLFPCQRYAQ